MRLTLLTLWLAASAVFSATATAQTPAAPAARPTSAAAPAPVSANVTLPQVTGKTLDGQAFDLAKLKGRVVMLMFWSTECAVCRTKMPELRENVKGWAGKPFSLVLVSADRSKTNLDNYNAIINKSVPEKERFTQLWSMEASYKDNLGTPTSNTVHTPGQWPLILVLDKTGKVAKRHQGRMPAEVWDDIAELL